ncbi:hypothetical protein GF324_03470 [bacterium]|nr:hypothetical protein [bacterium]
MSINASESNPGSLPVNIKKAAPRVEKQPWTQQHAKPPITVMREMIDARHDIQRHELAEEAVRQHFRDNFHRLKEQYTINTKA